MVRDRTRVKLGVERDSSQLSADHYRVAKNLPTCKGESELDDFRDGLGHALGVAPGRRVYMSALPYELDHVT